MEQEFYSKTTFVTVNPTSSNPTIETTTNSKTTFVTVNLLGGVCLLMR